MSAFDNSDDLVASSELVSQNLRKAIEDLRRDMTRVEMWADALTGFSQPIPGYDVPAEYLLGRRDET
ncbi:MAG: hypothetical protein AB7K04_10355 [Pseudorhodoplanes sp.]